MSDAIIYYLSFNVALTTIVMYLIKKDGKTIFASKRCTFEIIMCYAGLFVPVFLYIVMVEIFKSTRYYEKSKQRGYFIPTKKNREEYLLRTLSE